MTGDPGGASGPAAVPVHGPWHGARCRDAARATLASRGVDSVAVEPR